MKAEFSVKKGFTSVICLKNDENPKVFVQCKQKSLSWMLLLSRKWVIYPDGVLRLRNRLHDPENDPDDPNTYI